jgi:hypothetical protein
MADARTYQDFAEKLRLTAAAVGCVTYKDLCERFRAVNPYTYCDLARLQKWMRGRAMPRASKFYEDWAKVLELDRPASWLMQCSVPEFRAALPGASDAEPSVADDEAVPASAAVGTPLVGGLRVLCGAYACYSFACSPSLHDRLLRASLRIRPGKGGTLQAVYSETVPNGTARMTGEVMVAGSTLHMLVREAGGLPLFLSLILPGTPCSVMCGALCGPAFVSNPHVSLSRMLAVRVPEAAALEATDRCMESGERSIARDLHTLGLRLIDPAAIDGLAATFFSVPLNQVGLAEQDGFAKWFDAGYMATIRSPQAATRVLSYPRLAGMDG